MSPKIPPFPPREFATIDEVLAGSSIGSADREVPSPGPRAETPGKVYIAGGGPGALDLLTLRAARALGEADVVLLDHLAPQEFAKYSPNALIVDVGKVPGKHAVPQSVSSSPCLIMRSRVKPWYGSRVVTHTSMGVGQKS